MDTKKKITIILLLIIIFLNLFVSGIISTLILLGTISIYGTILYLIISPFKKIRNKNYKIFNNENFHKFFLGFLYRVSILGSILIGIIGGFAYYQNEISPALMPVYTLTNGEKTVVFQAMSHIGSENFYKNVQENIRKHKEDGFVLFFEGVRPGSEENEKKLSQALGVDFNTEIYKNFSKLYGLTYQDNNALLGIVNNNDFNIDVGIDDIIKGYEEIKAENNLQNREYKEPININEDLISSLAKLNEKELKVLRYVNKSIVNLIIKNEKIQSTLENNFSNKELFQIILDKRNEVVANEIITSEYDKIIVTYGLLHFKGIFEILKENNPKWNIEKVDYINVIK